MIPNLTTLDVVKSWLSIDKTNQDGLLNRLITACSGFVLGYMQRDNGVEWQEITDVYDGNGNNSMLLRQFPVTDVVSISLGNGQTVTAQATGNPPSNGYMLESMASTTTQQRLTLVGYVFPRGRSNISITYHAGYLVSGEAQTIPAAAPFVLEPLRSWMSDEGVKVAATGAAMTKVDASPAAGQYAVDANGAYSFAAADAATPILMSYSYCPDDIVQAVVELIGERYKTASRIGEVSHVMTGQGTSMTTAFSQKDMNDTIKALLRPYRKVTSA